MVIVLAVGWIAHFNQNTLYRWVGLAPQHSIATAIEQHLNHRYRWRITDANSTILGSIGLGYQFADSGYRIDNEIRLNDVGQDQRKPCLDGE